MVIGPSIGDGVLALLLVSTGPVEFQVKIRFSCFLSVGSWSNGYRCGMQIPSVCQITDAGFGKVS